MIRIAVCDDNINLANSIENDISSTMDEKLSCDVFYSGAELISLLQRGERPYHIYLLDIEMPQLNGIEAASMIRKNDKDTLIIFLTGHKEYVYDVFEVLPFRFLRKPAAPDELRRAVADAAEHIRLTGQIYFFQIGREKFQLHYREIIYMEGAGRKVLIRTTQQDYEAYGRITDIMGHLDKNCFCRTHASYIVNMDYIRSIINTDIFARLIFWLLLELINKIGKYEETSIPTSLWLLLMAIAISSLAALYSIFYYMVRRDNPYQVTTEIPVMLALLLINLALFVFFDRFSVLIRDSRQKLLLEQQLHLQEKHYRELDMAHQQIRSIQHDMNNYLQTLAQLGARQEGSPELAAFLSSASGKIIRIEQLISTGNACMDSILNIKLSEMTQEHIRTDTKIHVPPGLQLSFEQAVVLLGNLLDNAREACRSLPPEERWVKLQVTYTNYTLLIRIENSSPPVTQWKDGLPLSTKTSAENTSSLHELHGLGLKNVRRVVEKNGTFSIESGPSTFLVKIALYDLTLVVK